MNKFETIWRKRIQVNLDSYGNEEAQKEFKAIIDENPIKYSCHLIEAFREVLSEDKIKKIFLKSACQMPLQNLENAKLIYDKTKSIEATRLELERMFKKDIKIYKSLSDNQVESIIEKGWGLAGVNQNNDIIATKIPSNFHEYFLETDPLKKKYHYCHCPRVKKALLDGTDIDSIYCYCGGGFYQSIWEYITGKNVKIETLKSLFNGHDVCQFKIHICQDGEEY